MKQRVIGAIFVIAYFGFWFFAFSGRFFTIAIAAWLCIAALELIFSSYYMYNQKRGDKDLYFSWAASLFTCFIAIWGCFVFRDKFIALLAILSCWISDTAGFTFGKMFGKNNKVKQLKRISPNKSYAGFIGAIIIAAPLNFGLAYLLGVYSNCGFTRTLIFAACSGIIAAVGDLFGSAAKRFLGVKDSGEDLAKHLEPIEAPLIGGQGGYFDRADSVAPMLIVVFFLLEKIASH